MTLRSVVVTVTGPDRADLEELEESSRRLRDDLLEVDGVRIETVPDQPGPAGTRGFPELLAAFAVTYYLGYPLVKEVTGVIESWLQRHRDKQVRVTFPDGSRIEINGHDPDGTRELLGELEQKIRQ